MRAGDLDQKLREIGVTLHLEAKGERYTATLRANATSTEGRTVVVGVSAEGANPEEAIERVLKKVEQHGFSGATAAFRHATRRHRYKGN